MFHNDSFLIENKKQKLKKGVKHSFLKILHTK